MLSAPSHNWAPFILLGARPHHRGKPSFTQAALDGLAPLAETSSLVEMTGVGHHTVDLRWSVPRQLYLPMAIAIAAVAKMPVVCQIRTHAGQQTITKDYVMC